MIDIISAKEQLKQDLVVLCLIRLAIGVRFRQLYSNTTQGIPLNNIIDSSSSKELTLAQDQIYHALVKYSLVEKK